MTRARPLRPTSRLPLLVVAAFALALASATLAGRVPAWLWPVHVVASLVTLAAHALDKAAARRGARRTPERTLHALALAGGWPGALLAQPLLRHKTAKRPFLLVGWGVVALHLSALAAICLRPLA